MWFVDMLFRYVCDILVCILEFMEQVIIELNGEWVFFGVKKDIGVLKSQEVSYIDDDDFVVYENFSKLIYSFVQYLLSVVYLGMLQSGVFRDIFVVFWFFSK